MEGQLRHPKRDDAKVVEISESVSEDDDEILGSAPPMMSTNIVGSAPPMMSTTIDGSAPPMMSTTIEGSAPPIIRKGSARPMMSKTRKGSARPIFVSALPMMSTNIGSAPPIIRREYHNEQCIYVVPQKVRKVNPEAYTPQVVSIGPFHHPHRSGEGDNILKQMEKLKLKYLDEFLKRTRLREEDFDLKQWENRIRSCYARPVNYNSMDFLKMILIDACFIIEHFLRCLESKEWKDEDPISLKPWMEIKCDLILLENQLPFFVLEEIYNLGMKIKIPSFLDITFEYFKDDNFQNMNPKGVCPKHFTDLLRTSMLSPSFDHEPTMERGVIEHLYSATQLSEAGLVFKAPPEGKSLLDLKFQKGVLTMPSFHVYDTTEIYIRNILAFEVCHLPQTQYISEYLKILDFLINTEKDVNILVDKKIIVNLMGDANEVATMVNSLCKNIPMPRLSSTLCKSLNDFYKNPRNKYKAIFRQEYWNTPWKKASTIAAVLLLLLTLIQTICSVISLA